MKVHAVAKALGILLWVFFTLSLVSTVETRYELNVVNSITESSARAILDNNPAVEAKYWRLGQSSGVELSEAIQEVRTDLLVKENVYAQLASVSAGTLALLIVFATVNIHMYKKFKEPKNA